MGSFLDQMNDDDDKLESYQEEELEVVKVNYFKKYGIPAIVVVVLGIIGFFGYRAMSQVEVPDMSNWDATEVDDWASAERITIVAYEEYSLEYEDEAVISYDAVPGTNLHSGDSLVVTFSKGADPYETIIIPDISVMNETQVKAWIDEYQLTGISLDYVNSTVFPAGDVIEYEFVDGTETNFIRKNRMVITISDGEEAAADTVTVDDFVGLSEGTAGKWATNNGIILDVQYVNDTYYAAGLIISQSVKADYDIKVGGTLTIVVSLGEQITLPDFSYYSKADASSWGTTNGVEITIVETYSESLPAGEFISQDIAAGETVSEDDQVVLEYSLGKVKIYSYLGKSILDFESFVENVNLDGASISYVVNYEASTKYADGIIISHDYVNTSIVPGTLITVKVSLGDEVEVPDFSEMTSTEAKAWGVENGITITIKEIYTKSIRAGLLSYQSIDDGEIISTSDSLTLYYSIGQPQLISYVDANYLTLVNAIEALNEDGANLYYTTTYMYSDTYPIGDVINHTYQNEKIYPGSTVAITVSKGPGYVVPNFTAYNGSGSATSGTIGAVQEDTVTNGALAGYNIAYSYVSYSNANGTIVSQSVVAGTAIGVNDLIILYVSDGSGSTAYSG